MAVARRGAALYVATIARPTKVDTGAQTHVRTLVEHTARLGIRAPVLTPFSVAAGIAYPVMAVGRLARLFGSAPWVWCYLVGRHALLRRGVGRTLRRDAPAVVYAQDLVSAQAALDLRARGWALEVVLVVHSAAAPADEWVENGYIRRTGRVYRRIARLEQRVLPRVDRLVFPSDYVARGVRQRVAGAARVPSWRIPNCVFPRAAGTRPAADGGDLISIGALVPNKNHEFLLRVLAAAHGMGFPYRLTIVGAGPLRQRLHALAGALGVAHAVTFAGYVPDAAALLPAHRAYVHAARVENCCMAVLEALAAGRPVLAVRSGGIPEQVTDGVEGVHWELDAPGEAARRLIELLEDPALYARAARAAAARYAAQFTPAIVMPQLLDVLLGPDGRRASSPTWSARHDDALR